MTGSAKSSRLIFVLALLCFNCLITFAPALAAPRAAIKKISRLNPSQTDPAVVNLQDYGAMGDGVADAGPALQAALDDLALSGGGTLQVPAGYYRLVTPVIKHFSSDSAVTIEGAPSATQIDVRGNGTGLDLTSQFIIAVGAENDALVLEGAASLLIKDIGFLGVQTVDTDAHIVLSLSQIGQATLHHCEFYGLASLVAGGAIVKADHTDLTLEETPFLGCAGNSGVSNSVVQNTSWLKVQIRNCKFIDYGTRSDFFSKTPLAPAYSWINMADAADLTPAWSRREAILDNVFMDEGVWLAVSARPDLVRTNYPLYSVQMSRLNVNVNNLNSSGVYIHGAQRVLIDRSHFGWSHMAGAAIYLSAVGVAILDLIDTSDDATRIIASADRLSVINSVYSSLDSSGPVTRVITTDTPEEDPAQYVQQQYNNVLHHNADPAGYFYWTDKLLRCEADASCLTQIQTALASFLAAAPPEEFSWTGHVVYKDGTPIAGVKLSLTGFQSVSTETDASGAFAFGRLATAGEYELTATKDHCGFDKIQLVTPTGNQVTTITGTILYHSISGRVVTDTGRGVAGATLVLSGTQTGMATTDSNGNYTFANLPAGGNYVIEVSRLNYTFSPSTHTFNDLSADITSDFQGTVTKYNISGHVKRSDGTAVADALVSLSGGLSASTMTDADGKYSFSVNAEDNYTVRVSKPEYAFSPLSRSFNALAENQSGDFTASPGAVIYGQVTTVGGVNLAGVTLSVSGSETGSLLTDSSGNYAFVLPAGGNYTVTPSKSNYLFTPLSASVNNLTANQLVNFSGGPSPGTPVLLSGSDPGRALALDAVLKTIEPFGLTYDFDWSEDRRTRINVYVTNVTLSPADTVAQFSAEAEDASHVKYPLTVEYVGPVPEQPAILRLVLRLNDDLTDVGDVQLRVSYRGVYSDPLIIAIGHVGGPSKN